MKRTTTSLFILLFGATTFAQIPTDNLLCHLKFANDLTDETATATSSIVGNAAAIGYTADRFGNPAEALSIDNSFAGYVDLGDLALVDPDYSISLWMNFSEFSVGQRKVISKRAACTGGSLIDVTLYSNPNTLVLESYAQGSAVANINNATVLSPNTWIHVVFVVDQANLQTKYYIDGSLIATTDWGIGLNDGTMDNSAGIALGYSPCVDYEEIGQLDGFFDDLRIYTRSLTGAEVTALYNEENPTASITEFNADPSLSVYPNPTKELINVQTATEEAIQILTNSGNIIMTSEASLNHKIDVSHLSNGIYFVQSASGKTVKFIKE